MSFRSKLLVLAGAINFFLFVTAISALVMIKGISQSYEAALHASSDLALSIANLRGSAREYIYYVNRVGSTTNADVIDDNMKKLQHEIETLDLNFADLKPLFEKKCRKSSLVRCNL